MKYKTESALSRLGVIYMLHEMVYQTPLDVSDILSAIKFTPIKIEDGEIDVDGQLVDVSQYTGYSPYFKPTPDDKPKEYSVTVESIMDELNRPVMNLELHALEDKQSCHITGFLSTPDVEYSEK